MRINQNGQGETTHQGKWGINLSTFHSSCETCWKCGCSLSMIAAGAAKYRACGASNHQINLCHRKGPLFFLLFFRYPLVRRDGIEGIVDGVANAHNAAVNARTNRGEEGRDGVLSILTNHECNNVHKVVPC